jgi:hypothetical protein
MLELWNLLCVGARSRVVAAEVGATIAAEAGLRLLAAADLGTLHGIANKHTESLNSS